ncbi:MAG: hypothetical protein AAFP81_11960 [Pseudomonadota bacterium]
MSLEATKQARPSAYTMVQSNPADLLVSAINERLLDSAASLERRENLKLMSAKLRGALGFDPEALPPLPIQLGQNHTKACEYVRDCVATWLNNQEKDQLFDWLGLDDATISSVKDLLWRAVDIEPVASWICREFGGLRTSRQAQHARRYVAIKLARQLHPASTEADDDNQSSKTPRQALLDKWSDLDCPASELLHYKKVVKVYCNLLLGLEFDYQSNVVGLRASVDDFQMAQRIAMRREYGVTG